MQTRAARLERKSDGSKVFLLRHGKGAGLKTEAEISAAFPLKLSDATFPP